MRKKDLDKIVSSLNSKINLLKVSAKGGIVYFHLEVSSDIDRKDMVLLANSLKGISQEEYKFFSIKIEDLEKIEKKERFFFAKTIFESNFHCFVKVLDDFSIVKPLNFNHKAWSFYLEQFCLDSSKNKFVEEVQEAKVVVAEKKVTKRAKFDYSKSEFVQLIQLPFKEEELEDFDNPNVKIIGEIFFCEVRNFEKTSLVTLKITDYNDSITVKFFTKKPEEIIQKGVVEILGVVVYDDFNKSVVISGEEIKQSEEVLKEEILFKKGEERVELNCKSNFTVHDSTSKVDEIFKNAKAKGISALAIVDAENVQSFPSVEKESKKNGIKAIYGCEFNVINEEKMKIFNHKNKDTNLDIIVALDIETTGLSTNYDDITEISAIKVKNGVRQEYSVLIKLEDYSKLTPVIQELTGITKELLVKEGIDKVQALKGLLDFIEDGVIVAHNATFDVDFLEAKFLEVLNVRKTLSYIDTLNFSRSVFPESKRFGLGLMAKKLGVELVSHHRAIYDTRACLDIFYSLMNKIKNVYYDVDTLPLGSGQNYFTEVVYKTKLSYDNLTEVLNTSKTSVLTHTTTDVFQMEEGFVETTVEREFYDCFKETYSEMTDQPLVEEVISSDSSQLRVKLKYATDSQKKAVKKLNTMKGAKKNVKDFELTIEKAKSSKCSGTMNISTVEPRIFLEKGLVKSVYSVRDFGIEDLNTLVVFDEMVGKVFPYKTAVLVKNQNGLKDLYNKVSVSNTDLLFGKPLLKEKYLEKNKDLLRVSTSSLFETAFNKPQWILESEVEKYDVIEVNPADCYLEYSTDRDMSREIIETLRKIIAIGKKQRKIVIATSRSYYLNEENKEGRNYFIESPSVGGGLHYLRGKKIGNFHLRESDDIFLEIRKIDKEYAETMVYENPKKISDSIEEVKIIQDGLFAPTDDFLSEKELPIIGKKVPSILKEFEEIIQNELKKYSFNGKLSPIIEKRFKKEKESIVKNGFAVIYYIAYLLVKKSLFDGYIVGSRGSVGSSFVATLMGITEVNPLPPHYHCPNCSFITLKMTPEEKKEVLVTEEEKDLQLVLDVTESGYDLPKANCPHCGSSLERDGQDIPFETFLGFEGDKVPDIDLNFSGKYQSTAHEFCKEVFGEDYAFRAGTIATVASKTAFEMVRKTFHANFTKKHDEEFLRRSVEIEGSKRTTGQHPGGIIIIPSNKDILDFSPVQFPANDKTSSWKTTHFDFHAIHDNVLKLDILGHDDPTILRQIMDYVESHPEEFPFKTIKEIPLDDEKVRSLLRPNNKGEVFSLAIPEFGTEFVNGMLKDTSPQTFAELVKISGLSHGTDVWLGNAQELVNNNIAKFSEVIGCRDDIMVYLTYKGITPSLSFEIMEFVRKGKPTADPEKWKKYEKIMQDSNVPDWYIKSCEKIKYMFPKAHATAYVLSAMRIAWFKVHKPILFYSTYFSVRATDKINLEVLLKGKEATLKRIEVLQEKRKNRLNTVLEDGERSVLEVAIEAFDAGIKFTKVDINESEIVDFKILDDNTLLSPLTAVEGFGENAAKKLVDTRKNTVLTMEKVKELKILNKSVIETLNKFEGI